MDTMIEVRNLSKRFGSFIAVNDISFSVHAGEVLGFLGPNGAGKSTTMKMITGFLTPTSGSVKVKGHDVGEQPLAAKQAIGYLAEGCACLSGHDAHYVLGIHRAGAWIQGCGTYPACAHRHRQS